MVDATSGASWEIDLFWFMLIALVAVVAAVALAVLGDGGALKDSDPDRIDDRLPADRPVIRGDIDAVRLPVAVRGYRMLDVDEVLDRLGAELAERDARIAELESSLAGARGHGLLDGHGLADGSGPQDFPTPQDFPGPQDSPASQDFPGPQDPPSAGGSHPRLDKPGDEGRRPGGPEGGAGE